MIVRSRHKCTPTCDGCGAVLPPEYDCFDAAASMRRAGWTTVRAGDMSPEWYNFCPACKDRGKKDG